MAKPSVAFVCTTTGRRLGELHLLDQRGPIRRVKDDLVTRPKERERGVEERLFATGTGDDLTLLVLDAVVSLIARADRPLQLGCSRDRGVLREVLIDRLLRGGVDEIRRAEVRLARAEVDHLHALAAQPVDRGRDFHRLRRGYARGAIRETGHREFTF